MNKKFITLSLATLMTLGLLTACGGKTDGTAGFDQSSEITVISREDGSGTRGAFTELFGIEEKNAEGKKIDMTTATADITSSTGVVLSSVADNAYAIGYVSLGSLNDSVKSLDIDGVPASIETIKDGSYKISRPFNIATTGTNSPQTEDFLAFIISAEGQKVVEDAGYISQENTGAFLSNNAEGKVTISGSSSVTPVMEKLKEAYASYNANVTIEVSQTDSTNGMNAVAEGICDIGMASRALKESELDKGLAHQVIALDGIAVVVNNENPLEAITPEKVKDIYVGTLTSWDGL